MICPDCHSLGLVKRGPTWVHCETCNRTGFVETVEALPPVAEAARPPASPSPAAGNDFQT